MTFAPGQSGNLNGRPSGARNRRTQEILDLIKASGHKDPLLALSELVSHSKDEAVVAQASSMLAPYLHSKLASTPAPRYIEASIHVPEFHTIVDVERFLNHIARHVGRGTLSIDHGKELAELAKNWVNAHYAGDELGLKLAGKSPGQYVTIRVVGGLPPLPGTNIAEMGGEPSYQPRSNGHDQDITQPPVTDNPTD
jgi:hypothetical protein